MHQEWPIGGYGGEPNASGFPKHFLECGEELARLGRLDTGVRRQLVGAEPTHPEAPAQRAQSGSGAAVYGSVIVT